MLKKKCQIAVLFWSLFWNVLLRMDPHLRSILPWVLGISLQEKQIHTNPIISCWIHHTSHFQKSQTQDDVADISFLISLETKNLTQHKFQHHFASKYQLANCQIFKLATWKEKNTNSEKILRRCPPPKKTKQLPKTNKKKTENRPSSKGKEKIFQPSMASGANLLASFQVNIRCPRNHVLIHWYTCRESSRNHLNETEEFCFFLKVKNGDFFTPKNYLPLNMLKNIKIDPIKNHPSNLQWKKQVEILFGNLS